MTQRITAFGQDIDFPEDMSDDDIASAIKANESTLNPDYVAPKEGLLSKASDVAKDFSKEHLGVDFDARNAYQDAQRQEVEADPDAVTQEQIDLTEDRSFVESAKDTGLSVAQGGAMAVEGMAYLAKLTGLPTEGIQDKASEISEKLQSKKTPQSEMISDYVMSKAGFVETIKAAGKNPGFIAEMIAQSAALMIPGGVAAAGARGAGSLALKLGAGQRLVAEAGMKAAISSAAKGSVPLTAGAIRTAQLTAKQKVLATLATGGAIAGEGLTSAGVIGSDVEQFVNDQSFEDLSQHSERFNELTNSGMSQDQARLELSKELSTESAMQAGAWTSLVSGVTGAGRFLGEVATGTGKGTLKEAIKNTGRETLDEVLQEPGETFYEHQGKVAVDPSQGLDLPQAAALGAMGGFGQSVGMNAVSMATSKASEINDERTQTGLENIGKAQNVDEAINAASQTVSGKTVTKDDVLVASEPTLADITRLTGLTPSEALTQAEIDAQQFLSEQGMQSQAATQVNSLESDTRRSTRVTLPSGDKLNAQWDVVEADSVNVNLVKGEAQPRDRSRAASNVQVQSIANNLDYDLLESSPVLDAGSPTLSKDGQLVAGNGRFAGIEESYKKGTHKDYLNRLQEDAVNKGIDPAVIGGMKNPVLVRRITDDYDTRKLAIASNSGLTQEMSTRERAALDAERMEGIDDLTLSDAGTVPATGENIGIIRKALSGYDQNEVSALQDEGGGLSQAGAKRVQNALLSKAYGDTPTLGRLIESIDDSSKNVLGALVRSAGAVSKVKADIKAGAIPKELDITNDLVDSVEVLAQIKEKGQSLENYLAQTSMIDEAISDSSKEIMTFLHDNIRSQKRMADFIQATYETISKVDQTASDIFGDTTIPSKQEIIKDAAKRTSKQEVDQKDIFADSETKQETGQKPRADERNEAGDGEGKEGRVKFSKAKETITVDGVERPTTNSDGKPIHPTEEGIRNFWEWFSPSPTSLVDGLSISVVSGLKGNAKLLSDFVESESFVSENKSGLIIPRPVLSHMVGAINNNKIIDAVVRTLPVDVVDFLSRKKFSAKEVLNDVSMLEDVFTIDPKSDVALTINPSAASILTVRVIANTSAKVTGMTNRALERNATVLADTNDPILGAHIKKSPNNDLSIIAGFGDSKVVDDEGRPRVVYHQTSTGSELKIYEEGFRLDVSGARKSDPRVPDGIFLKPTDEDIGVGAKESSDIAQMQLYTGITNPLYVETAEVLGDDVADTDYTLLLLKHYENDAVFAAEFDEKWNGLRRTDRHKFKEFTAEYFPRVREIQDNLATKARERITSVLSSMGHDGVIISNDKGSFGRLTKTYIAFKPNQIKSVDNAGSFSKDSDNILFSKKDKKPQSGITKQAAEQKLKDILGDKTAKVLLDSGIITLVDSAKDIKKTPGAKYITDTGLQESLEGSNIHGLTFPDGRIVLVLNELTESSLDGVIKHEGFHSTVKNLVGADTHSKLLDQLNTELHLSKGSKWVKDAYAAVPDNTHPDDVLEEVAAYAIEQYANGVKQPKGIRAWVEAFLSAIRTAIIKSKEFPEALRLWAIKNIQPQDLANLAVAGLRARAFDQSERSRYSTSESGVEDEGIDALVNKKPGGIFSEARKKELDDIKDAFGDDTINGVEKTTAEHDGIVFETGKPVTFPFLHNKESATKLHGKPNKDSQFGRQYEPSGRYVTYISKPKTPDYGNFESGEITFSNPLVIENDNLNWKKALSDNYDGKTGKNLSKAIIADGYDGVVTTDKSSSGRVYTSEILDLTTFDEKRAKFSKESKGGLPPIQPDLPGETRARKAQRTIQDKFNRFTVIKEFLADQGINLSEQADVYAAEERYHSKVSNQTEDFREHFRNPLIERIAKAGFTMSDVADYLEAQHAQEANEAIQELHSDPTITAYGITDKEARAYLDKADKELAVLANEFRSITDQTKKLRLDNGLLNKDIVDAWDAKYKHYIPVKGGEEARQGKGKGLKVNFKTKRRLGHGKRDEAVIENILMDHERAIMEVEKNRVGKHIVMMAAEAARDDLLTIGKPEKRKLLSTNTSYGVSLKGKTVQVFQSKEAAQQYRKMLPGLMKGVTLGDMTVEKITDERVSYSASPMLGDNEINVYIDGHAIRVQIKDDLLAEAYGNLGIEGLGKILSAGRILNSYLSKVYTGYNPEFILTNIIRDFSTGIINLTGEEGIAMAGKAVGNYAKSFGNLLVYATTNGKKSNKWIDAYRANGGNTGAAYLSDMERLGTEVATEYAAYQGVIANLKQGDPANAARAAGKKAFNATLKWIQNFNQAGENAMRLAAFQAMIESNKTVNEAAHVAKNITVNFNRKGARGAEANALWLFFNASLQGIAATSHALTKGKHKYQAWALATSMTTLGYMAAVALGGGDEDDYDKIDDYTKERNVIIFREDGSYHKIPIPYGYGFFWSTGRLMADAQRKGETGKLPWRIAASGIEELTPFGDVVGGSEDGLEFENAFSGALPTVLKIPQQVATNRSTFSGSPLRPESPFDESQPDREKMWRGTQGTMYDITAGWLETAVGMDVSPETLKYYTRTFTGGAGAFADTAVSSAILKKEGAELDTRELPFIRKLHGELTISNDRSAYYKAADEAKIASQELNRAKRDRDIKKINDIASDKKEMLAMHRYANKLQAYIKAARDEQDALRLSDDYTVQEKRLKLKELEKEEAKLYDKFLGVFKEKKSQMRNRVN